MTPTKIISVKSVTKNDVEAEAWEKAVRDSKADTEWPDPDDTLVLQYVSLKELLRIAETHPKAVIADEDVEDLYMIDDPFSAEGREEVKNIGEAANLFDGGLKALMDLHLQARAYRGNLFGAAVDQCFHGIGGWRY